MRALLQRVSDARVVVDDRVVGEIGAGWLVLLGIGHGDGSAQVEQLADKVATLRCFADEAGKTNLSITDVGGSVLVVSQFTLYAQTNKGRRPTWQAAAPREMAEPLVTAFADALRALGASVQTGVFGASMAVALVNDGPVTLILEA